MRQVIIMVLKMWNECLYYVNNCDNKRDIPATLMFPISSEQNTTSIRNMRGPYIKEIYCRNAT